MLLSQTRLLRFVMLCFCWVTFVANAQAEEQVSISGTLLMLDDKTPHVACVVQVVTPPPDEKDEPIVVATTLSDETGKYQFVSFKPGGYQVRCYTKDGYVYYQNREVLHVEPGKTLRNIDFRFAPFKKGVWRHYIASDGLAYNAVNCIFSDLSGMMLFGTDRGGVTKFDGNTLVPLTANDGSSLPAEVWSLYGDSDGILWIGTHRTGLFRYDGKEFRNFRAGDGLLANSTFYMYGASDGTMWFNGYLNSGVSRYDGESFAAFPATDAEQPRSPVCQDTNGRMWFITGSGFCRYDGQQFVSFTLEDGFEELYKDSVDFAANNGRQHFHRDPAGRIWTRWHPDQRYRDNVLRYDEKGLTNFTSKDGLPGKELWTLTGEPNGDIWLGWWRNEDGLSSDGVGLSRYDGVGFINFTIDDGMLSTAVKDLYVDTDGALWVATGSQSNASERGGVSRYDNKTFVNFTTQDGLLSDRIQTLFPDADGNLWVGTVGGGVVRYDGKEFVPFATESGLTRTNVSAIHRDRNGYMWFGTGGWVLSANGIWRYDPSASPAPDKRHEGRKALVNFTTEDGLVHNDAISIHQAPTGELWFGTSGSGVSRFDGREFVNFTTKDGLGGNMVSAIHADSEGIMWFATDGRIADQGGLTRYDGKTFVNFTTQDGLASNLVRAIYQTPDSMMWIGTCGGGVSRFDGKTFVSFTTEDGLASNFISTIHGGPDGILWFGTDGRGVCGYDGKVWTWLDKRDGLAGDIVNAITHDAKGSLWFGTLYDGLTRYQRTRTKPTVHIISVTTDQTYHELDTIGDLTIGTRAIFTYNAIDFKTLPEKRQYRLRIVGENDDVLVNWHVTKEPSFDHLFTEAGIFTFEVVAIDRDLNYSQPARVTLRVVLPWYTSGWILYPSTGGILALALFASVFAYRYYQERQRVRAYQQLAVTELQDARRVQMGLMPEIAPELEGLEIAGKCVSANTVSGDFFDYLTPHIPPSEGGTKGGEIAIVVGDVTGHGMQGAMNAVMTDGVLRMAADEMVGISPAVLLEKLNHVLTDRLEEQMNVTMVIGLINGVAKTLTLANAGHHAHPLLIGSGTVDRLVSKGMPLGMMAGISYREIEFELQSGDVLVFMTDGIIEAKDRDGVGYQETDRLQQVIAQFTADTSAEAMVSALITDATTFGADMTTEEEDDITVVVVKVL